MKSVQLSLLVIRLTGIIVVGTVFFRFVEGWNWIDAYFFTVVTLSTVGYGSLVPGTLVGKIGATVLIFAGLGVFAVTIQQIAASSLERGGKTPGWLMRRFWGEENADEESSRNSHDRR